ncbi:Golgi-specific brefeldin A-resistance guanine nucleotide exchange factor 1-like isoform X2 [Saccostrea echinata]|uniref:Golgi-specific brefeldin A-resistance guanine nucleotide exchange factor 1-like isoform X2 n=1 Tax=Saccostrea echinata TaxID=191078 RepID=UPI002A830F64|nr:Golgi-specific brefeldin A-resistance guanine nucleotide exchange factor 1-like isoform X2 [Saccostrea echinata]
MGRPQNGIYIIQGEISLVVTAMKRSSRWVNHTQQDEESDPLLSSFSQLKDILNNISDLDEIEPNAFLGPFLEVIRSEDTTGPITGLALTSVNKFLSYGLVDSACETAPAAIENIADAVTHARFVGTDPGSDEVVLMKILHVLRTLLLAPAGVLLTNESVCEIMQSCFRICFEMRLSELLRKSAEHTLMDMVQLLFSRLPQFKEDPKWVANMKKLKMRTGGVDPSRMGRKKRSPKPRPKRPKSKQQDNTAGTIQECENVSSSREDVSGGQDPPQDSIVSEGIEYVQASKERLATTPATPGEDGVIDISQRFQEATDKEKQAAQISEEISELQIDDSSTEIDKDCFSLQSESSNISLNMENSGSTSQVVLSVPQREDTSQKGPDMLGTCGDMDRVSLHSEDTESVHSTAENSEPMVVDEIVNPQGVRFTPHHHHKEGSGPLLPYGLPCVRELFRFLISLTNPLDRHNTDVMIHMGLSLLSVALESGADHIGHYNSLLYLVKDEMCRHLFLLLQSERLSLFSASLRVCFLLFESIRSHLKLQLEFYLTKLTDIIVSESPRISYEIREIALESIVQLWRIPGLVTELYLNYDCDLYCSNLFEDLTKLLSKNAFPVQGLFSTHLLSLDALLTVVDSIEQHCHSRILSINKQGAEGRQTVQSSQTVTENGVLESSVPSPPTTGYVMAQKLLNKEQTQESSKEEPKQKDTAKRSPSFRQNRMKVSSTIPTAEDIATIKHKKKLYYTGTEQFNTKPSKGITYLQEQGLLSDPLDPGEVVTFLKENPRLDKAMIGEYVAKKTNSKVLEAFVKSFNFEDLRVDEALRQYLEAFRLPGEAPVISYLIEHFSDHWHKSNGEPFANADAAFTLTYAIIMLNVDQHNHNAKKQNIPMTGAEFKKNLKKCNGGADFDQDMLEEIYVAIKNEEIVMPAEHTGLVKENYLWKVLLRRGTTKDGLFLHVPSGSFDHDLFTLIWGPTVAALSFVFDKSSDDSIIQKAIAGFRKCAMISAHYGMSDVFDNLVISLCKFTTLLSSVESPEHIPVMFGSNSKAQLAARTVFGLAHRHGDILREGWKNILDCMLQLYRAKLLPKGLTEVEDFIDTSGKICIVREETTAAQRSEGVLSSFYSYFTSSEPTTNKGPTPEEQEASKQAQSCIRDCHLEQLILDSKFLREDSLQELIKAQIFASQGPEVHNSELQFDEDAAVFFLELLIKVILQNRDRVVPIWQNVRDHLYSLIVNSNECTFLVERAVVGLLRLAIRLLRREEVAPQVLTSLRILLMMKPTVIHSCTRQISYALHELLRTNAANIHTSQDWFTLFTLLEVVGAGANPPPLLQVCPGIEMSEAIIDAGAQSDSELPSTSVNDNLSDRGYTSDSEISYVRQAAVNRSPSPLEIRPIPDNGSWLLVNKDSHQPIGEDHTSVTIPKVIPNQYSIELNEDLHYCDSKALLKSSETLAFLVRDAAHVTPLNFESCVHSIRAFVEASVNGGRRRMPAFPRQQKPQSKHVHKKSKKDTGKMKKSSSSPSHIQSIFPSDDEGEEEGTGGSLASLSIQLLDLMHTLHTRAATIFTSWAEEENNEEREAIDACHSALWVKCWCPLLQGIARLCCDTRRQVRSQALTYLQRALLVHDLQTLSAAEWEACFNKVLFPLLTKLLENINVQDPSGMEETRMRASTLLCKVFLQHLSPLLSLSTFTALWLTILDFMDKYMHTDNSDLLSEAIPESLKNMLLVMDTANIFHTSDGGESQLWKLTWDRIDTFLPHLQKELFKPKNSEETPVISSQPVPSTTAPVAQTLHEQQSTAESPPSQIPPEVPLEGITVVKEHSHGKPRDSAEQAPSDRKPIILPPASSVQHPVHTI